MKSFEWTRFCHTLRWVLISGRGTLVRMAVCMFILFFAIEEVFTLIMGHNMFGLSILVLALCLFVWMVGMQYAATQIIADTGEKTSAIRFLMHPASNLEKFIARWIYVTVVWAVVSALAFIAADTVSWAFNSLIKPHTAQAFQPMLWRNPSLIFSEDINFSEIPVSTLEEMAMLALMSEWGHSMYILGGTVFRRHRFVLTLFASYILNMVFSLFIYTMPGKDPLLRMLDYASISYWWMAIVAGLIVLDYLAAYRIFTRTEVVGGRYVNARYSMLFRNK